MPLDPDLSEVLEAHARSLLLDVHTAIPGKIKSYDAAKQTAEVIVQVRAQTPRDDGSLAAEELPVLPNVPVQWPRGGGYALHFPLTEGDFVLLVFSEAAIGHWRETGQLSDPGDLERHGIGYPFAIPGIAPNAGKLTDAPTNEGVISVADGKVLRVGPPTGSEFVVLADKLKAALSSAATSGSGGAVPNDGGKAALIAFGKAIEAADFSSKSLKA